MDSMPSPSLAINIFLVIWTYYAVSCFSLTPGGGAGKFWGKEPTLFERWAFDFFAFGLFDFVLLPFLGLNLIMTKEQQTRLCYGAGMCVSIVITALGRTRSQSAGGLLVDKEHRIGFGIQLVILMVLAAAVRGETTVAKGVTPFSGVTYLPRLVMLLEIAMTLFYVLDMTSLSTLDRYVDNYDELKTPHSIDANMWFVETASMHLVPLMLALTYLDNAQLKSFNLVLLVRCLLNYIFFAYHLKDELVAGGTGFKPEIAQENTIVTAVLVGLHVLAAIVPTPASATAKKDE